MYNDTEFTALADDIFYDTLESARFRKSAPAEIFSYLKSKIKNVPFCDYLKRLIFIKAGFTGAFDKIDIEECRRYLIDSFRRNCTPPSFEKTTVKLSAVSKNWLNAFTVSRETVFLIGFGLNLNSFEVSELLSKGLNESKIYYKNPFEAICSYCFDHNLKYDDMRRLYDSYSVESANFEEGNSDSSTMYVRNRIRNASDEKALREIMSEFHLTNVTRNNSAGRLFNSLYNECCGIVSLDFERDNVRNGYHGKNTDRDCISVSGVTASDIERELNTGTPLDSNGNLVRFSDSELCEVFRKKRLNRKRLNDILNLNAEPDRFDLITLKFFINSERDLCLSNNDRWWTFVEETNTLLERCSMGQLYNANPYDAFLQMCLLTDVPLATYDEILEMSYSGRESDS